LISMLIYFALVNFFANLSAVLSAPLILSFASADSLGIVQTVGGFAMLAGSLIMGMWGGPRRRILGVYGFIALMGVGLMVTGLQPSIPLIAAGFFIMLFAMPIAAGSSQALWQSKVDPAVQGRVFATRSMISRSIMPLAFLLAGPLADRIFEPLMATQNALTNSPVGSILGRGAGRGVGLMFTLSGMFLLLATAAAYAYPRLRLVEDELPDVIPDAPENAPPSDEAVSGVPTVATAG
jgi:MFS family permease